MATETTVKGEPSSADYLERALDDLNRARHDAGQELRSVTDSAISHTREALDHLKSGAEDRTEHLRARAEKRTAEWQRMLEGASEEARRELGIRTVRAQHNEDALEAMSEEIEHQRKQLGRPLKTDKRTETR
jgi:uncharacterized protein YicC (UPF0701 family)